MSNISPKDQSESMDCFFSAFFNDQTGKILRPLINVYADNTTVYRSTSKIQDVRRLAVVLSAEFAHCWVNWILIFSASKTKLVLFHNRQADPEFSPDRIRSS